MFLFHSPLSGAGRLLESNREVGSREMTTDSRPPAGGSRGTELGL